MEYNGTIYRPPVEANTLLLPVTEGCTHNSCNFCNMYLGVRFRMLPPPDVEDYLRLLARHYGVSAATVERIYLVGADPFALSARNLTNRIDLIRKYFPSVKVVTMYAAVRNIKNKSDEELATLKDLGVDDLYVGVETGLDDALLALNKGTLSKRRAGTSRG